MRNFHHSAAGPTHVAFFFLITQINNASRARGEIKSSDNWRNHDHDNRNHDNHNGDHNCSHSYSDY